MTADTLFELVKELYPEREAKSFEVTMTIDQGDEMRESSGYDEGPVFVGQKPMIGMSGELTQVRGELRIVFKIGNCFSIRVI